MKNLLLTLVFSTIAISTLKSQNFNNKIIFVRPYLAWQDKFRLREGIDIGANINNNLVSIYTEDFKTNNKYMKWFLGCRYGREFSFDDKVPGSKTVLNRLAIAPSIGIDVRLNGLNPSCDRKKIDNFKNDRIVDYSAMKVDNMISLRIDCAAYFRIAKTISIFGSLGHQYYWSGDHNNNRDRIQIGTMIGFCDLKIKD